VTLLTALLLASIALWVRTAFDTTLTLIVRAAVHVHPVVRCRDGSRCRMLGITADEGVSPWLRVTEVGLLHLRILQRLSGATLKRIIYMSLICRSRSIPSKGMIPCLLPEDEEDERWMGQRRWRTKGEDPSGHERASRTASLGGTNEF